MSLTEVMVGGAVLAGVGLAATNLFKNQNLAQKMLEHESNLNAYHQSLAKILSNVSHCNATLYDSRNLTSLVPVTSIKLCDTTGSSCVATNDASNTVVGVTHLTVGQYIDGRNVWRVTNMVLPPVSATAPARLQVTYELTDRIAIARKITKDILLHVRFDTTGTFRGCTNQDASSVDNLQREMCSRMTGVDSLGVPYNFFDENDQKCKPRSVCPLLGYQLVGIKSDGAMDCRKIIDPDFNPNVDSTDSTCVTGQARLEYDPGTLQLRVKCL